jgi:hypothetical protein
MNRQAMTMGSISAFTISPGRINLGLRFQRLIEYEKKNNDFGEFGVRGDAGSFLE